MKCSSLLSQLTDPLQKGIFKSDNTSLSGVDIYSLCLLFLNSKMEILVLCPECNIKESRVINAHCLKNWWVKGREQSITKDVGAVPQGTRRHGSAAHTCVSVNTRGWSQRISSYQPSWPGYHGHHAWPFLSLQAYSCFLALSSKQWTPQ